MDDDFETAQSGASKTYPKQCSALRKGEFVLIKGKPCKIVEMSTSKTGKHGHAKVHMVGLDIFDGKKCEDICPSTHNMECPNVIRKEYPALDIDGEGYVTIMEDSGDTREDLQVSGALLKEIKENLDKEQDILVAVLKAMDKECIMSMKPAKGN